MVYLAILHPLPFESSDKCSPASGCSYMLTLPIIFLILLYTHTSNNNCNIMHTYMSNNISNIIVFTHFQQYLLYLLLSYSSRILFSVLILWTHTSTHTTITWIYHETHTFLTICEIILCAGPVNTHIHKYLRYH